ncbi:MAG TPA: hypothetical protein DD670_17565 [Planctomycetaceae bacterium]|nr:hypothetical protein [Planctomycetaceae bacterium]
MTNGDLTPIGIFVGYNGSGSFTHFGGTVGRNLGLTDLYVGYNAGDSGTYQLSGSGTLRIGREYVGYNGTGTFTQLGGTNNCSDWLDVRGTYNLSSTGILTTFGATVSGTFNQTGGTHTLNAGASMGGGLGIEAGGKYILSGTGAMATPLLSIGTGGTFEFSGGTVQLKSNYKGYTTFTNQGVLDGAGGSGTMTAPSKSLFDFSEGSVVNAQSMSVTLGSQSLVILPAGYNPTTAFGSYNNSQGVTYIRGTTFSVPAGRTCNVQPYSTSVNITDRVSCQGSLSVFAWNNASGPGMNLSSGVTVSGSGTINGVGNLTVNDAISSMTGGSLNAYDEYIGRSGTGTFTHSAGTNTLSEDLWLGYNAGDTGTYNLSGSGTLKINITYSVPTNGTGETLGYYGTGNVTQTGGTNLISTSGIPFQGIALRLGYMAGSVGNYTLGGSGLLKLTGNGGYGASCREYIGYSGSGTFTQTGGTNLVDSTGSQFPGKLYLGYNAGSSGHYDLRNGQLSVSEEYIGYHASATALFQQSGGTNATSSLVVGSGSYHLHGGTLMLKSLSKRPGTGTFNFGGGTLRAAETFTTELPITLTGVGGNANVDTVGYAVTFSGGLSGEGGLNKFGAGTLTLDGTNTYTGDTTVSAGSLALASTGALLLDINSGGDSTSILGAGAIALDGTLVFDVKDVATLGDWNVLAVNTLAETYGGGFTVKFAVDSGTFAATETSLGVWTYNLASLGVATFTESTGVLSVVPEPGPLFLLSVGLLTLLAHDWRQKRAA